MPASKCPKCDAPMERGFTIAGDNPPMWVKGDDDGKSVVDDDQLVAISTLRCTGCGYLESYAAAR